MRRPRRNHCPAFKARVALEAPKSEQAVAAVSRVNCPRHDSRPFEAVLRRADSAEGGGRTFGNYSQRLSWDETEVMLFLRKRSRVPQFSRPDIVERLGCPARIFKFERQDE